MKHPFCSECKWYVADEDGPQFGKCSAPQNNEDEKVISCGLIHPELKTQVKIISRPRYTYCSVQRSGGWFDARITRACGREGRWFQGH